MNPAFLLLAAMTVPLPALMQTGPDAAAIAELSSHVDAYVALHRQLEGPVPTIRSSDDADEVRRAVEALGARIRSARRDARPGAIFTPSVSAFIRARIDSGCGGDLDAVHEAAHDEVPPMPRAVVNGHWPGPAMTFMPPRVLCQLPPLPEELEYRFVNRDLVLWDAHADVVVDVLPGALRKKR
jgi:hypothetical protein